MMGNDIPNLVICMLFSFTFRNKTILKLVRAGNEPIVHVFLIAVPLF